MFCIQAPHEDSIVVQSMRTPTTILKRYHTVNNKIEKSLSPDLIHNSPSKLLHISL